MTQRRQADHIANGHAGSAAAVLRGRETPVPEGAAPRRGRAGSAVAGSGRIRSVQAFAERFGALVDNVEKVIHGKTDVIRLALVALFAGGHVLYEDVPGVGKSMLARAIGRSINAQVNRIQCTADMLPSDITGSSILDSRSYEFQFRPGPVFANILLADEINRATPKTQSALLEAMAEQTVTVDGITHQLPRPFLVLATQNPVELAGTFPLPEAQLDRFLFRLAMGYPSLPAERSVLTGNSSRPEIDALTPVMDAEEVLEMTAWSTGVSVAEPVLDYIIHLCQATRSDPALSLGAGPRASQALLWAARVLAASQGREDVYPDEVRTLFPAVIGHRVLLSPDALVRGDTVDSVIERVFAAVRPPSVAEAAGQSRS